MGNSGYNPTRRNRNIGTSKSGHSQNNRLTIPWAWTDSRIFYERLNDPIILKVKIGQHTMQLFVEPTLNGFAHACTPGDLVRILKKIPYDHLKDITLIVLRQPKRKELILSSVWGRLLYWSNLGACSGPAIFLEAMKVDGCMKWGKSLTPDLAIELSRLRSDGHEVESDKRHHYIWHNVESVRSTQLYRTLPHEIGHYVHYLEVVEKSSRNSDGSWESLNDKYHQLPPSEKESYAHRYADNFLSKHKESGFLPFSRIDEESELTELGLLPEWFGL